MPRSPPSHSSFNLPKLLLATGMPEAAQNAYRSARRRSRPGRVSSFSDILPMTKMRAKTRPESPWRTQEPNQRLFFLFAHRAWAAFLALSLRCSGVSFLARALPPLRANSAAYDSSLLAICTLVHPIVPERGPCCKQISLDLCVQARIRLKCSTDRASVRSTYPALTKVAR